MLTPQLTTAQPTDTSTPGPPTTTTGNPGVDAPHHPRSLPPPQLDVERRLHPDLSLSALVALLIRRGHEADDRERRNLVEALGGGEDYPPFYSGALRREWPT